MRTDFLPFSRPTITKTDTDAVVRVLQSGWITTGSENAQFEENFRQFTSARQAVSVSSATAAMHLLLQASGIEPGDEVITPSMTWVSTVNLIVLAGATPVFADVDPDTLMVTPETVAARLTDRTRMIVPVHFAGAPADLAPLSRLAKTHAVSLIQDGAHALGSAYRGERIGKTGTTVFSFHPIKNMTSGEGGMICSDDTDLLERVRRLRFHGLGVDAYDRRTQGRAPQAEVITPGFKYNLPDILAALGVQQLARLPEFNARRQELVRAYHQRLDSVAEIRPLADPPYPHTHARHLFIVRLDAEKAGFNRDYFMEALQRRNIGTGLHFRAVHLQKYYREHMPQPAGLLPNTEWNSARICSLPLFPQMTLADVDDVVAAVKDVLAKG